MGVGRVGCFLGRVAGSLSLCGTRMHLGCVPESFGGGRMSVGERMIKDDKRKQMGSHVKSREITILGRRGRGGLAGAEKKL